MPSANYCLIDCAGLKLYVRADKPSTEMRNALETTLNRSGYHETVLTPTRAFVESCPVSVNGVALKLLVDSGSNFTYLDDDHWHSAVGWLILKIEGFGL